MAVGFPKQLKILLNGHLIMLAGLLPVFTFHDYATYIQCRFVDRDMMMRYHHFLGIGHTYSNTFRPAYASPQSASAQDAIDEEMSHLCPTTQMQAGETEVLSDTDSINTIDNGWQGWDDEGEEDDDVMGGCESDGDLLDMDDMYGN
jgi:hypothetical protein